MLTFSVAWQKSCLIAFLPIYIILVKEELRRSWKTKITVLIFCISLIKTAYLCSSFEIKVEILDNQTISNLIIEHDIFNDKFEHEIAERLSCTFY